MATRKKVHKKQDYRVTYEYEQCDDGEARLQKIFEFLLAYEVKNDSSKQ